MSRPGLAWGKVTIDSVDPERAARFWGTLLDLPVAAHHDGWFQLGPPVAGGPALNFQPVGDRAEGKSPVHLDVWVDDVAECIVLVEALGGRPIGDDPTSERTAVVMADPDGIEFCLIGPIGDDKPA